MYRSQASRCSVFIPASLLLLGFSLPAPAQTALPADTTFRIGLKTITIPPPSPDLTETGPDYRVLLQTLVPTNNRLVAAFLTPDDFTQIRSSTAASLSQYALVQTARRAEFADITPEIFKQVDSSLATQFEAAVNASLKDHQDEINRRLKALGQDKTVTLDKPLMLGSLFSKPDASGYGQIVPVTVNDTTKKIVVGMTLLRVRERMLFLFLYTPYKDEDTVKSVRATSEKWADAVLAANK